MKCLWLRVAVLIISGSIIAACATPAYAPPSAESLAAWNARKPDLLQFNSWQFTGRVVIKTEEDTWSGVIYWDQHPDTYQISFKTPLGQSVLQLQGDAQSAVLTLPNQKKYRADDAESLIFNLLGWSLPLKTLVSWVAGIPSTAGKREFLLDDTGRILELKQAGWNIHFKRYMQANSLDNSLALPKKLFLDHEEDDLNIRLVIDRWML